METWTANEECLNILMSMGISKGIAEQALYYTGNNSADAAASFVFDNPDFDPENVSLPVPVEEAASGKVKEGAAEEENSEDDDEDYEGYKMVFIVNSSLKMGVGKLAAQVAHACLGLFTEMLEEENLAIELNKWKDEGQKKVVLRGDDVHHLLKLEKEAAENKLHSYLIRDAGRTQIAPNSVTVLGIFGKETEVNAVTGKLALM